jgi:hypothetical protein
VKTLEFTVRVPASGDVSPRTMRDFLEDAIRDGRRVPKNLRPLSALAANAKVVRAYAPRKKEPA